MSIMDDLGIGAGSPELFPDMNDTKGRLTAEQNQLDNECLSCEENAEDQCLKSQRECGHHCNHVWSHEECCWCGEVFGPIEDSPEIELGRPIGH